MWPLEKWKPKSGSHFPTAPTASGRREETQKKTGTHLSTQERGLLKRLDRPDHSAGLGGPAQANYQHPRWAKSDDRSGPGRMIKLKEIPIGSPSSNKLRPSLTYDP